MKISKVIETLERIKAEFGDIAITGGAMMEDRPLSGISVTDDKGMQIWPRDVNGVSGQNPIDGVFLQ